MKTKGRGRVLIVDAREAVCHLIGTILSERGFDVVLANDGHEALKRQREHPFPLILTDIFLSEKDGLEIIQEVRKGFPKTGIIAMASDSYMNAEICLNIAVCLGANEVLRKPFGEGELMKVIDHIQEIGSIAA